MAILEICCYSMECARMAQQNDADRIELCLAPKERGLTPSLGVLRSVRQHISIPVNPITRPRGGDFCYTEGEFAAMLDDIAVIRELGFSGLVTGILGVDDNVDMSRMEKIVIAVGLLRVTLHWAFDMCANPLNALKKLADLGIVRVLTSGQKSDAVQGLTKTMELIAQLGAPVITAGAGVRVSNLSLFLDAGVQEVHSSAGVWLVSPIRYRNSGLSTSLDMQADEYSRYTIDGTAVAEMKVTTAYHQAS